MPSIRHFAIMCDDPTTQAQFYHEVFDMEVVWRQGPHVYMSDGTVNVALLKARPDGPKGINHFGFLVEDMEEIRRRMELAEVDPPYQKPDDGRFAELGAIDSEGNRLDLGVKGWETARTKPDMTEEEWFAIHPGGTGAEG